MSHTHAAMTAIGGAIPPVTLLLCVTTAIAAATAWFILPRNASGRALAWRATLLVAVVVPAGALLGPTMELHLYAGATSSDAVRVARHALASLAPPTASTAIVSTSRARPPRDVTVMLGWLWLAGFMLVAARTARELLFAGRLRSRAVRACGAETELSTARACERAHYRGAVSVLVSLEIDVPLVIGVLQPAIIVPASSSEWSASEWDVVLLHEIAHLARHDLAARVLGMIAGFVHWFNPVVPWLRRRLERDAELAADDAVLRAGIAPCEYADVLLAMAERASWHEAPAMALTLARADGLERRIGAILLATPRGRVVRSSTEVTLTMVVALVAFIAGCVQLRVQSAGIASDPRSQQSPRVTSLLSQPRSTPPAESPGTPTRRATAVVTRDWRAGARAALIELLDDPSPQVRAAAARSLEQFGGVAEKP